MDRNFCHRKELNAFTMPFVFVCVPLTVSLTWLIVCCFSRFYR